MTAVRSTATATRGNQQLSLLQISHDSLFAQTLVRGGDDGQLSFARVLRPLLPFFLRFSCLSCLYGCAGHSQVGGLGRQQLLADGAALAGGLQGKILSLSAGSGERLPLFVLGLVLAVGQLQAG